jgi:molybdopterin/thiamine biosynthesis adenylyltransferase
MWNRVERLMGEPALAQLARARVGVVGLGSGGGFAALTLAMSGVGAFVLVDDDALDEGNIMRHVADRRYLGQPKAEAVADLIRQRNPQAQIETRIGRFENHLDALDGLDLLVVGVDHENTKYRINRECLTRGLVAVYAGVYERGEGGDCVVVRPYETACYACWAAELRAGITTSDAAELDYGMIGQDGSLEAEPALWLHVVRVAGVQADLALNALLAGTPSYAPPPANTVVLANRSLEIVTGVVTPMFGAEWIDIPRDPACLVCGDAVRRLEAADEVVSFADLLNEEDRLRMDGEHSS